MQHPIRVRAKPGVLVPVPRLVSSVAQYVNRDINHDGFKPGATHETDLEKLYPIRKEPDEISVKTHGYDVYAEIQRSLREGDLLREMKAATVAPDPPPHTPALATSHAPPSAPEPTHSDPSRHARSKA
jgi:hypothetical protein